MNEFYPVEICGRKENLPVIQLDGGPKIAFFNLHGNADLTEYCASKLAERLKGKADVLITAESKGLQLTHCVARNLGHKFYAAARKSRKLYMKDGISVEVNSITTRGVQKLYLSAHDVALLRGKRVALVDDVISTGESIEALGKLVEMSGGTVTAKAAVLAEGNSKNRADIIYLADIPLL